MAEEKVNDEQGKEKTSGKEVKVEESEEIKSARKRLEDSIKGQESELMKKKPLQEEKKQVVDTKATLSQIQGQALGKVVMSLGEQNAQNIFQKLVGMNFSSRDELVENLIDEMISFLRDWHRDLKVRISKLRKSGINVNQIDYSLMVVPLKLNLFKTTLSKSDFDKVLTILKDSQEKLKVKEGA